MIRLEIGRYRGLTVYLKDNCIALELDRRCLVEVKSPWKIADIVHENLGRDELHGLGDLSLF